MPGFDGSLSSAAAVQVGRIMRPVAKAFARAAEQIANAMWPIGRAVLEAQRNAEAKAAVARARSGD